MGKGRKDETLGRRGMNQNDKNDNEINLKKINQIKSGDEEPQ